jgi:hypothetical protein
MPVTVSSASYAFNTNELMTLGIAAYAAIVATFLLGWDAYKWLASGARIDLSASSGMQIVGGPVSDPKTYVSVTALNVGDRPTTITNLGGMYFESWWRAYVTQRKPKRAFIITEPSQAQRIPYRFEVGAQWMGMTIQTEDIAEMARNGYLFLILYTASGGRGKRVRIRMRDEKPND